MVKAGYATTTATAIATTETETATKIPKANQLRPTINQSIIHSFN
jgi:hypothetical protein